MIRNISLIRLQNRRDIFRIVLLMDDFIESVIY